MKSFGLKLRLIYYPFLLIAAGFLLFYSLLNAWLTIDTATLSIKEEVTDLWLPLVLPFIPVIIWLRPSIKLLNLKTKRKNNLPILYLVIAALAIGAPAIVLQTYLRTAMGKLTTLSSINQIRENKLTRYYSVTNYYVDTSLASFRDIATVSGKHNEHLNYAIYIACPMFDKKPVVAPPRQEDVKIGPAPGPVKPLADSIKNDGNTDGNNTKDGGVGRKEDENHADNPDKAIPVNDLLPQAWACVKYTKQVSNRLDASERKEQWKTFAHATLEDFNQKDPNHFVYLDRIGNTDDRDHYEKDIIKNPYFSFIPRPLLVLEPRFTAFEARNGHKLGWVFGSFGIGALVWLIMLAIPKLDESGLDAAGVPLTLKSLALKKERTGNELKEAGALLLPRQGYAATPILIDLNILVFILMVLAGKGFVDFQGADLLAWGANYRPLTSGAGQWWRLLTSTFVHAGVMHLLFNMAGLLFAGILLEPALGRNRLAVVYLLTGIAGSLTSLWWHPATVSVGASGAIFGLYGVFLALLTTKHFPPVFKKSFTVGVVVFVAGNLLIGLTGGIDNAAHTGGLVSGLVAGYILYPRLKREKEEEEAAKG